MAASSFFKSLTVATQGPIERKPSLSGLYLRFLEQEQHWPISPTLYAATKEVGAVRIIEIKGTSDAAEVIELPPAEMFCLIYQFIGNSVINAGRSRRLQSGQHIGCGIDQMESFICKIARGRTWMLIIALLGDVLQAARDEFSALSHQPKSALPIGYRQRSVLDKIQQLKTSAYTLDIKLTYHIALLVEQYQQDIDAHRNVAANADIALYHKAVAYIQVHYTERKLTRRQIADALCVSVRTLTRAFEGRRVKISGAIQLARLHKAREQLRQNPAVTIADLASSLHFADERQFNQSYADQFGITPEQERRRRR